MGYFSCCMSLGVGKQISILGCGWLGFPLAKAFVQEEYTVLGSTTSPDKENQLLDAGIEPFVFQAESIPNAFLQSPVMVITLTPQPEWVIQKLIDQIKQQSPKLLVVTSSTSVYPDVGKVMSESDAIHQKGRSGIDLLALEQLYLNEFPQVASIVRLGGLFGPDRNPARFFKEKPIPNAQQPVNMTHLADAIHAIVTLVKQQVGGKVFNVVSPEHPTREAFYTSAATRSGYPNPQITLGDTTGKVISSAAIIRELNYTFIHPNPIEAL